MCTSLISWVEVCTLLVSFFSTFCKLVDVERGKKDMVGDRPSLLTREFERLFGLLARSERSRLLRLITNDYLVLKIL